MTPRPAEFRARLAVLRWPRYELAAEVGQHPTRLGLMLNGRLPMPPAIAERIAEA